MKLYNFAILVLATQLIFPVVALGDSGSDNGWASERDPLADFCNSISRSFTSMAKSLSGNGDGANGDDIWSSKRGGWDANPQQQANSSITIISANSKSVASSKNIVINQGDGSRTVRRVVGVDHAAASRSGNAGSSHNFGSFGGASHGSGSMSGYTRGYGGAGVRSSGWVLDSSAPYGSPYGTYGSRSTGYGFSEGSGSVRTGAVSRGSGI